ncbi:MAG: ABC transporter ATP-binding protein [Lachnospiraceae bacterium]|nr:ABC transporter ATP-binding protein [Lachnospiraceae bacterium]
MEIKLNNVSCGYKNKTVLSGINLTFNTGNIYCILGANGIGKTTLFKSMLGFIDLVQGDITIADLNIQNMTNREIAMHISYVPQAKIYSMQYSVFDIILMGRALYVKKLDTPSQKDIDKVNEVIKQLKIEHLKDMLYSELSGGEQQVVLVARALVQGSKFIIMDEPASNLDFENQKKVLDVLKELTMTDMGVIMSSHSPDHALYCDSRVVMIRKDKTFVEGSVEETINQNNLLGVYGVKLGVLKETSSDGKLYRSCCLI